MSPESIFLAAGAAYGVADYTRARDLFEKIVLENPRTPLVRDSLFYLAECELVLGDNPDAEKHYRTLLALYPDSPFREASAFRLGDIAWRAKNASQSLLQLDQLTRQFPDGAFAGNAFLIAADIHFTQGNYALALAGYEEAFARLSDDAGKQSALYSKGLALLALGRLEGAQQSFGQAAAGTNVDIAEKAGFRSAVLLAGAGRQREAEAALDAFLNRFPDSGRAEQAAVLLASLLVKSGDTAGALARWDLLVKSFPASGSQPEYLYKRGMAQLALDHLSAALDDFQAVVTRFPPSQWSAQSTYAIGYVYSRRAEYPRALQYFQAAMEKGAGADLSERSRLSLALCLYNMGSFQKALVPLEQLRTWIAACRFCQRHRGVDRQDALPDRQAGRSCPAPG